MRTGSFGETTTNMLVHFHHHHPSMYPYFFFFFNLLGHTAWFFKSFSFFLAYYDLVLTVVHITINSEDLNISR